MGWATKERNYTQKEVKVGKGTYSVETHKIGGESTTKVYTKGQTGKHEIKDPQWKANVLKSA